MDDEELLELVELETREMRGSPGLTGHVEANTTATTPNVSMYISVYIYIYTFMRDLSILSPYQVPSMSANSQ